MLVEVILMAKKTQAGTNVQKVKQQNAQAAAGAAGAGAAGAAGAGNFNAEFGSETNAAEVAKKNQKSQARKK